MNNNRVMILGAGIAGLTAAIALKKRGIPYTICEAAKHIGPVGAGLGLGANAIKAFKELGIDDEVMRAGRILSAFGLYDEKGRLISRANSLKISSKYGTDNFTIHRHALHEILLKHAGHENVICNKRAVDMEQKNNGIEVKFSDNTSSFVNYLIVSDGLHSPIRKILVPGSDERYAGYTCWRGVTDGTGLNLNEAMEIWGKNGRVGVVPIANDQIYWFLCVNTSRNNPEMRSYKTKDLLERFRHYTFPVPQLLERTNDSKLIWSDICDLRPINKFAFGNIVLIGDAAHATTPNMGQGACQAIEDAVFLGNLIEKHNDFPKAFSEFERLRLQRTHFVVNRSWQIGKIAQWENSVATGIRNFLFRMIPQSVSEKQLAFLYNIDFKALN